MQRGVGHEGEKAGRIPQLKQLASSEYLVLGGEKKADFWNRKRKRVEMAQRLRHL